MNKEEIREALKVMDVATARGRRTLTGRQIDWSPCKEDCASDAYSRAEGYLDVARYLRGKVTTNHDGITDDELESVEFVMEQLEDLSRKAHETALKNY